MKTRLHSLSSWRPQRHVLMLLSVLTQTTCNGILEKKSDSEPSGPDGFTQGQQPVPTTGTNLADYNNARVRCDYKETATANTYNAQCSVVAHQANGQEYFAVGVKSGVTLSWQPPQAVHGNMAFNACNPQGSQLTYQCSVTVTNTQTPAEAAFAVQVKDGTSPARTESANLLLPYSVGVAGGFVPSMPFQYIAQSSPSATGLHLTTGGNQLGYQEFDFPTNLTPSTYPTGIALCGQTLYYASGSSVFQVKNKRVSFYAGSANSQDLGNQTNARRLYILPWYLACAPGGGILTSSSVLGRIYKIADDGAVKLLAGNGAGGDGIDGNLAINSPIADPRGLAVNSKGDIIFANLNSHTVRMITHDGLLQTVAGSGSSGYAGDGGPALAAALIAPISVAVGPDDSIYVADPGASVVRKIATNGMISTVAGTGTPRYSDPTNAKALSEPSSVFVDATGAVYVGERLRGIKRIGGGGAVTQVVSAGADVMQDTGQMLQDVHAGNMVSQHSPYLNIVNARPNFYQLVQGSDGTFYTDGHEGVIAYPTNTASATIFVGAADAAPAGCAAPQPAYLTRLYEASALAIMPDHSLSVIDYQSQSSDQLVLHNFALGAAAGDTSKATLGCQPTPQLQGFNPILEASVINSIGTVVSGKDGSLYFANLGQNLIVKVTPQGSLQTLAGNGTKGYTPDGVLAAGASIETPIGIAVGNDGSVYFVEYGPQWTQAPGDGSRIRRISPNGILSTVAGTGNGGDSGETKPAVQADIRANTLAIAGDGRIFIADFGNHKIKMIDTQGNIHTIAGGGTVPVTSDGVDALQAQLLGPSSISLANNGTLYFVNFGSNQVMQLRPKGDGTWTATTFFGARRTTDCGTSKISGVAAAGGIGTALKSSLSIMCQGVPRAVTVADTCPAPGGDTRIAISQAVDQYTNIIQIIKPCGT